MTDLNLHDYEPEEKKDRGAICCISICILGAIIIGFIFFFMFYAYLWEIMYTAFASSWNGILTLWTIVVVCLIIFLVVNRRSNRSAK